MRHRLSRESLETPRSHRTGALALAALLAFVSPSFSASSRAAPSSFCPGYCSDTPIFCGAPSDCDGLPCIFQPECLAGESHAVAFVESILPEWSGGLNDHTTGWSCGLLDCVPGAGFLAFASRFGSSAVATKDIALPPGRYLAVADMAADPGAWGYFDIASAQLEAVSDVVTSRDWSLTSAAFEVPEGHSGGLQFRLHADGDGYVRIRRIFIATIREQGVFVRFRPVSGPSLFRLARVLDHSESPPGRAVELCSPDGSSEGCLPVELGEVRSAPDGATPWIDLGSLQAGSGRMTVSWDVFDCTSESCAPPSSPLRVTVELAYAPEDSAVVGTLEREVRAHFGLVLPKADAHPFDFRIESLADLIGRDFENVIGAPDSRVPERFKIGLAIGSFELFEDAVVDFELSALLHRLGTNTQSFTSSRPSPDERARASNEGLRYRWLDLSQPATHLREAPFDFEPDIIAAEVRALLEDPGSLVSYQVEAALDDFGAEVASRTFGHLGESIGFPLSGQAYRAAYRDWLLTRGETELSLGLETLDSAEPLESATPELAFAARPNPVDVFAARRWYLALEFWNEASAQVMALITRELEARLGPVPMTVQYGDLVDDRSHTKLSGLSLGHVQRFGSPTAFLATLDTFRPGDCHPWHFGAWADYVHGLTDPTREVLEAQSKSLPLGVQLQTERVELGAVLLELASRGFTWFNHLSYGPRAVHDASARGGESDSRSFFDVLRAGHDMLTRAEDFLEGATHDRAEVVIMIPDADAVWSDEPGLARDEIGWHMALSQNSIPVEFMRESEVAYGLLSNPLRPRRALILLRKHVTTEAWSQIERWVEDGGTVVLGPQLAAHDEFGQLVLDRLVWSGISPGDWRGDVETMRWTGSEGISSFVYSGRWRSLSAVSGTTLGVSEDDEPIALRLPLRRGRIIALGLSLGEAFSQPLANCSPERPESLIRYPDGFSPVVRDTVNMLMGQARVGPVFEVNPPMLNLRAMRTSGGTPFVFAVHWGTARAPSLISIPEVAQCKVVRDELSRAELAVSFGRIFAETDIASIFTWETGNCLPETSDDFDGAEVEPLSSEEDGCAGTSAPSLWLSVFVLLLTRRLPSLGSLRSTFW
jgi:hypothetical protein